LENQTIPLKDLEKKIAAEEAVKYIKDNTIVGLGTGSTAYYAILAIADLVKNGLNIQGVPTSEKTASLALSLGIKLIDLKEVDAIDVTIDGADEFTSDLNLIKGGGGALFREKIVASLTKTEIIIADSAKKVDRLGKFKIPVEVEPLAYNYVNQQIIKLSGKGALRKNGEEIYLTDNHNYIIDADFGLIDEPEVLSGSLNQIEGVLAHGLFINLTSIVIMGKGQEILTFNKS
jgi:ribose 5-phosphate isomerase A